MKRVVTFLNLVVASIIVLLGQIAGQIAQAASPEDFNRKLGVGVNLGNALDAPNEGEWGFKIEPEYLKLIKEAGFKHVRVPTRWSAHAMKEAPYTVEPKFFDRVDQVMQQALDNKLLVVLNMHHYEELEAAPDKERARFLAIWHQIALHLRKAPEEVAFEIYNEPCKEMNAEFWNKLYQEALQDIRRSDPERIIVVGPVEWNKIHQLKALEIPENDKRIIVTVHYYEPFYFTHQGAEWVGKESEKWLGSKWLCTDAQKVAIDDDFNVAAKWGDEHHRPIYLGEFGAYSKGEMESRARWTTYVRQSAIKHGFSAAYWEFGSGFGVYDPQEKKWRQPLLDALIGK